MEKALQIINQMQSEDLFSSYALGGGIAALFYIEPFTTFDLDIFIILPQTDSTLVTLSPIYSWLRQHGYVPHKEQIIIEEIPVQLIPAYNELISEAVSAAVEKKYGNTATRVIGPEYLVAIMLQTSRPKDKERLLRFLDDSDISQDVLDSLLTRHSLKNAYDAFRERFYGSQK